MSLKIHSALYGYHGYLKDVTNEVDSKKIGRIIFWPASCRLAAYPARGRLTEIRLPGSFTVVRGAVRQPGPRGGVDLLPVRVPKAP